MEFVFETSDSLEAHLIKDLLERNDIPAQVLGDKLQGGVGELSPIGFIKVGVENQFANKAKAIILEWENVQPKQDESLSAKNEKSKHSSNWAFVFVSGLLLGALSCYWIFRPTPYKQYHDINKDGHPDLIYLSEGYSNVIQEDNNFDKSIDQVYVTDQIGMVKSSEHDYDFDGFFETKGIYKLGRLIRIESDFDADGNPETIQYFKDNVLFKMVYKDKQGKIRREEIYRPDFKVGSAKYDKDGNGLFDVEYKYDDFGEIIP